MRRNVGESGTQVTLRLDRQQEILSHWCIKLICVAILRTAGGNFSHFSISYISHPSTISTSCLPYHLLRVSLLLHFFLTFFPSLFLKRLESNFLYFFPLILIYFLSTFFRSLLFIHITIRQAIGRFTPQPMQSGRTEELHQSVVLHIYVYNTPALKGQTLLHFSRHILKALFQ
jgi:hypothetical protein